jgi:tyrosine-protein phosphatase YwqE
MLLWAVPRSDHGLQPLPVARTKPDSNPFSHPAILAYPRAAWNHIIRQRRFTSFGETMSSARIHRAFVTGGELAETEADHLSDAQLRLVALGGAGGWVLLEPAPGPLGEDLKALVDRLAERGLRTVVAHPERHAGVDFEGHLRGLVSSGCLIQWTAEFVADAAAGDLVLRLAGEGLVHLLGSDAHSSYSGRPVRLAAGFARLATICTPAHLAWMVDEAPRAILRGDTVILPQ